MEEKCANCKHLGEIYVPPRFCPKPIYLKCCFLVANEYDHQRVMYLNCTGGLCECFEPKEVQNG